MCGEYNSVEICFHKKRCNKCSCTFFYSLLNIINANVASLFLFLSLLTLAFIYTSGQFLHGNFRKKFKETKLNFFGQG